jgi:hypothetical protein
MPRGVAVPECPMDASAGGERGPVRLSSTASHCATPCGAPSAEGVSRPGRTHKGATTRTRAADTAERHGARAGRYRDGACGTRRDGGRREALAATERRATTKCQATRRRLAARNHPATPDARPEQPRPTAPLPRARTEARPHAPTAGADRPRHPAAGRHRRARAGQGRRRPPHPPGRHAAPGRWPRATRPPRRTAHACGHDDRAPRAPPGGARCSGRASRLGGRPVRVSATSPRWSGRTPNRQPRDAGVRADDVTPRP